MTITEARNHFYTRGSVSNIEFTSSPTLSYKQSNHIILVNDDRNNVISFSFNGEDLDGELFPRDKSITLNWKLSSRIWLFTDTAAATPFRIWAWFE